ncbi:dihydrolipoamide acetyltransferase family protein [Leifsonia kafniensis]|uniref:Dihydrolipoamide acetyltransferase component of pyruvate dehydrogenase complex n=1 Tax=Leifsonia kafniensis TaxID=475957 RepID=A0ABP7L4V1_9MICO
MIKVFSLPDLGEGLTESEVVAWHVVPGDIVALNQHIADVETAKAVVELPSPFAGTVTALHQQPGVVIQVGDPLLSFEVAETEAADAGAPDAGAADVGGPRAEAPEPAAAAPAVPAVPAAASAASAVTAPEGRTAVLVGYGAVTERAGHPVRKPRTTSPPVVSRPVVEPDERVAPVEPVEPGEPRQPVHPGERPRSSPPVRALARELGVDLLSVSGTGAHGLITRDDVTAQAESERDTAGGVKASRPGASVASHAGRVERETRSPIRSLRKLTAAAMVQSAFTAPHVTEFLSIDVTPTLDLIETLNQRRDPGQARIGILAVVAKALCIAVDRQPAVNTRWDDAAGEIVQFHYVNLGIAVATPRGLVVPNLADADQRTLPELADEIASLADAARGGTTSPADLRGGTITITNIGVFGVDAGTPILNPGEAAILAMGAIRRQPWEHRGEIALRQVMTLALSFDHRLVDGEQGARFLTDIGAILANPGIALTMV